MSSRRSVRQLLVAVLLGVLVGGGLMAVTPAGAEVSNAVATNWKKIWKKNLKPLADKRYYTKAASDAKYQPKGSYEAAGAAAAAQAAANAATDTKLGGYYKKTETYSKAEADAKYAAAGSGYTKAESDGRFARAPQVIRGVFAIRYHATAAGEGGGDNLTWGINLAAPPIAHYIPDGGVVPAGCSGSAAAPGASAGHLCVFEGFEGNQVFQFISDGLGGGGPDTMGAYVAVSSAAAGEVREIGSWALGVSTLSAGSPAKGTGNGVVVESTQ